MIIHPVPRWIHAKLTIPQSGKNIRIDPSLFANTEPWPWNIKWLSLVGNPSTAGGDYSSVSGGVGRRLNFEIGITGASDINLVPTVGTTLFSSNKLTVGGFNTINQGIRHKFDRPPILPRDAGLIVDYQNLGADTFGYPSIIAYCQGVDSGKPVILAGRGPASVAYNTSSTIDSADLMNKGREAVYVKELVLDPESYEDSDAGTPATTDVILDQIHWRVNPSVGVQWMPRPNPIPAGNVAPYNRVRGDYYDTGPRVYEFPRGTYLYPRQRLGIRVTEVSAAAQTIHLCLYGEVEAS